MKVSEFLKVTSAADQTRVLWILVILVDLSYFFEHMYLFLT